MGCKGIGQVLRDFSGWTSAHGLPHIGSAQNPFLRAFWTLVTIASLGMFVYQMLGIVKKYFSYGVTMQTELHFEERVFPAVTLCHLNPFKADKLVVNGTTTNISLLVDQYKNAKMPTKTAAISEELKKWGLESSSGEPMDDGDIFVRTMKWSTMLSSELSDYEGSQMAYSKDDLVMNCAYNTKPCNDSDTVLHKDPYYGYCYTFNSAGQYSSTRAGPLYGLRMLVRTNQEQYLPYIRAGGIRVAVHGQNESAFPDALGLSAAPGFSTSYGIKFVKTNRKPAPYGECTETTPTNYYYTDKTDYSMEACYRSCLQDKIIADCKCYDPMYKYPSGSPSCASGSTEEVSAKIDCIENIMGLTEGKEAYNVITECKNCPQPCEESTYTVTVSTALWPSDVYQPTDCNKADLTALYWQTKENCIPWYKQNTLLIEVYYERMNYQKLSESPDYSVVSLISDTGGQLGLWLGVSFITCVEFCSLMALLCLFCMSRTRDHGDDEESDDEAPKKQQQSDQSSDSESDVYSVDDKQITPPPVTTV